MSRRDLLWAYVIPSIAVIVGLLLAFASRHVDPKARLREQVIANTVGAIGCLAFLWGAFILVALAVFPAQK